MLRIFGVLLVLSVVACSSDKAGEPKPVVETKPKASEFGPEPERPYVELVAKPAEFSPGDEVRVIWRTGDANQCVAEGAWSGKKEDTGVLTLTPDWTGIRQYTLACFTRLNREREVRGSVVIRSVAVVEAEPETEQEPESTELLGEEGGIVIQ